MRKTQTADAGGHLLA